MKNIISAAITSNMSEEFFHFSSRNTIEKFCCKKIFLSENVYDGPHKVYEEAEIVNDIDAIVKDEDISLVFVSACHIKFVPEVLKAGKCVRVIHN